MNFEEIIVGERYDVGPVPIEREKVVEFALNYDPLPVHYDEEFAKKTRYAGLIAPGVMSFMSAWSQIIRLNPWGENLIAGKSTKIEWLAPVRPGDSLHGCVVVTDKTRRNPYNGVVEVTADFYNQNDVHVIHDVTEMVIAG